MSFLPLWITRETLATRLFTATYTVTISSPVQLLSVLLDEPKVGREKMTKLDGQKVSATAIIVGALENATTFRDCHFDLPLKILPIKFNLSFLPPAAIKNLIKFKVNFIIYLTVFYTAYMVVCDGECYFLTPFMSFGGSIEVLFH